MKYEKEWKESIIWLWIKLDQSLPVLNRKNNNNETNSTNKTIYVPFSSPCSPRTLCKLFNVSALIHISNHVIMLGLQNYWMDGDMGYKIWNLILFNNIQNYYVYLNDVKSLSFEWGHRISNNSTWFGKKAELWDPILSVSCAGLKNSKLKRSKEWTVSFVECRPLSR